MSSAGSAPPDPGPPGPAVAPTRPRNTRRALIITGTAVALFVGGGLSVASGGANRAEGTDAASAAIRPDLSAGVPVGDALSAGVARLQRRLAEEPDRAADWAALGAAYVQQARVSVDPAYYPKAEGALKRSLALQPEENLAALIGMGTLANARHDFARGVRWAKRAQAVSAYNPRVYGVLADAYTQLGKPAQATAAIQRMLDVGPGLPSFSRASYDLEQRGDIGRARELLKQALAAAYVPADIAFCRYYLGELAYNAGDLASAGSHYSRGLVADPQNVPLLQGVAKVAALRGDISDALAGYADLVNRVPNPQYLVEYGELLAKAGRATDAADQFALVRTVHQIFTANGGQDDLALAEYEADHGSAVAAVAHARTEWSRRQSVVVADALGWALHKAGRHAEALTYADRAVARGWRNALFFHHRGEIQRALGNSAAASADAARSSRFNPRFDPALPAFGRAT